MAVGAIIHRTTVLDCDLNILSRVIFRAAAALLTPLATPATSIVGSTIEELDLHVTMST